MKNKEILLFKNIFVILLTALFDRNSEDRQERHAAKGHRLD